MSRPARILNPWHWDLPLAALACLIAVLILNANLSLFLGFNRLNHWTGDLFWAYVTMLGDTLIALIVCLPLVRRWPQLVWAGLLAGLVATLFVHGLKPLFGLARPASILALDQFHVIGRTYYGLGFPSGHSTTAFTLIGVIVLHLNDRGRRWLGIPLIGLAALIGLSRIVVGAHWPLDVLAGAAGGWLSAVVGTFWALRWQWGITLTGRRWMTVLLIGCALSGLLYYPTGYPQTDLGRQIVALLGLGWIGYQLCVEYSAGNRQLSSHKPGQH